MYDHNVDKMTDWYQATRTEADPAVRDKQWLLIGPWVHGGTGTAYVGSAAQGELNYANAAFKNDSMARAFFAHYLMGIQNNWESTPKITYYELGKNTWNTSNATTIAIYGNDGLLLNPGQVLSTQPGSGFTSFTSDPANPSPTIGGPTLNPGLDQGPYDQAALDARADVRAFSTAPLAGDVTISGRVKLNLYVQGDQSDADIAVRLADVYPDGRSMLINDGIRRMRFRNGYTKAMESFMVPGQVYPLEIALPFVHYTWKTGHAIKIYLSGNSSTRWDVNLQNGGPMYAPGDTNVADIRIYHSPQYPSKITLPGNNGVLASRELPGGSGVELFPNPATDVLTLKSGGLLPASFEIIDEQGRVQVAGAMHREQVNIAGLNAGVYIVRLLTDNGVVSKVFVKK
ncbi:MAG: CocE/NonD family hydrolase [Saprospirales bacterium]|nr:CocE/NonD family hydrolase [Saprospirales bacterium]